MEIGQGGVRTECTLSHHGVLVFRKQTEIEFDR